MKHAIPASATEVVETVARLSKATLSASARSEMAVLAEECLAPEFLEDSGIDTLSGVLDDLKERCEVWVNSSADNLYDAKGTWGSPEVVKTAVAEARKSHKAFKDCLKAVEEALQALGE